VVKIGGGVLDDRNSILEDMVELQKQGVLLIVVHGGGQVVSDWLHRLGISPCFVRGLRVTDKETLRTVVAVLGGLVNKELVTAIQTLGGKVVGLSGCDGNLLRAQMKDPELGYVGEVVSVNLSLLETLLGAGYIPLVAPVCTGLIRGKESLLNVNGDTIAGEIAGAVSAGKLIFLTDVDGIYDGSGKAVPRLGRKEARKMIDSGLAAGGMIPKIEAGLKAMLSVPIVRIIDGRKLHALFHEISSETGGTTIVAE
jgi:acetylglutamate kinase